jgi:HAD superfamily hydrolase (TIGR01509 family)
VRAAVPLPAAVLFDMDGLLVDTEHTWFRAETEVMARLGGPWGPEHQQVLVGGPLPATVRYMRDLAGSDVPPETVARWLLADMAARLRRGVTYRPGARELLHALRVAGVPCGLVSASYRTLMDAVLAAVGDHHFAVTVAGDEVVRTKPHPEPYLTAAAALGLAPRRCVVLEDSPTGVAAAEAAGCVTVAVPSVAPIAPAPGRTVVRSLVELDPHRLGALVPAARV